MKTIMILAVMFIIGAAAWCLCAAGGKEDDEIEKWQDNRSM